jgi:hypothetical protein
LELVPQGKSLAGSPEEAVNMLVQALLTDCVAVAVTSRVVVAVVIVSVTVVVAVLVVCKVRTAGVMVTLFLTIGVTIV